MGIPEQNIKFLMREGKQRRFSGSILTIGRQTIYSTKKQLFSWAEEMKFTINEVLKEEFLKEEDSGEYITDDFLFRVLGFEQVDSMDISDFEQATIIHDLNIDVPDSLLNKYDMIYDGGSSEHIFNIPKVFENYNKMLKIGGRMIHAAPSSGYFEHGFYMFSPNLFYDYYSQNKWRIIDYFITNTPQTNDDRVFIYEYKPGYWVDVKKDEPIRGVWDIFFVTQKNENSTYNANIQQGTYLILWKRSMQSKLAYKELMKNYHKYKVILFGASNFGKYVWGFLNQKNIKPYSFCDNDPKKWNTKISNLDVISPDYLYTMNKDETLIIVTSQYNEEIVKQLKDEGFEKVLFIEKSFFENVSVNDEILQDDNKIDISCYEEFDLIHDVTKLPYKLISKLTEYY